MTEEVRLKGFSKRAPLKEVTAWMDQTIRPLGVERVPFRDAADRVIAEDIIASRSVPAFARAAMDGYAVRAASVPGALTVSAELTAADQADRALAEGQAIRIMTGAAIPDGADAVVMVEDTRIEGDRVEIGIATAAGRHILKVGEDILQGTTVLKAGRRLRPQDVAMLVQAGALEVAVRRKPRVVILPTGTELLSTGRTPAGSQVVESNSFMLEVLARRDGADPVLHPIVEDDMGRIAEVMTESRADVLVVTGGSSIGREDFAPVVANNVGEVAFHGIALKPGSSTGIGRVGATWVVLGPGYPVAAFVAWELVVAPLLARLLGTPRRWPYARTQARLAEGYRKKAGRTEFVRVTVEWPDGGIAQPVATVLPGGSAILSTLTAGDGFLLLDDEDGPLSAGDEVIVHLF